jgi:hypothetical protein
MQLNAQRSGNLIKYFGNLHTEKTWIIEYKNIINIQFLQFKL